MPTEATTKLERQLDAAIAVASAVPGGAVPAAALAVIGKGGLILDQWSQSAAAERERQQFEEVIWQATLALANGDADVAAANVAAHADDAGFRARVHATVSRMRESNPCDAALTPLGLLIAHFEGSRTDERFRRVVGVLSDLTEGELHGAEWVLRSVFLASGNTISRFAVRDGCTFEARAFEGPGWTALGPGERHVLPADAGAALAVFMEHRVLTDIAGDSRRGPAAEDEHNVDQRDIELLALALGMRTPSVRFGIDTKGT